MGVGDLEEWLSLLEEPSRPMTLDHNEGNWRCLGRLIAGLAGGEVSGLEAMGLRGLVKKNLVDRLGVNVGSGCKGADTAVTVVAIDSVSQLETESALVWCSDLSIAEVLQIIPLAFIISL